MADAAIPSKSDLLAFTGDYSNGTQGVDGVCSVARSSGEMRRLRCGVFDR